MIHFDCPACGARLKVSDDKAGKVGPCPQCGRKLTVPVKPVEQVMTAELWEDDPQPGALPPSAAAGDAPPLGEGSTGPASHDRPMESYIDAVGQAGLCPSCHRQLPPEATLCVACGVYVPSGRPLTTARGVDEDELAIRVERIVKAISWIMPFGLWPIWSEATGRCKPIATFAIVGLTTLISVVFWVSLFAAEADPPLLNWMLWAGDARQAAPLPPERQPGDPPSGYTRQEMEEFRRQRLAEQRPPRDRYHIHQLITHALLHGDIMHLVGNMVFLLVIGSRINSLAGNLGMALVYPLLAVLAGLVHLSAEADGPVVPMVGASGAIMGLAGMYLVLFPLQRIYMVVWLRMGLFMGFRLSQAVLPVMGFGVVLFYIAFDLLYITLNADTGTAHWAHMGGFVSGVAVASAMLAGRLVQSGCDVYSLTLGRYAWPIIGSPRFHAGRGPGILGLWIGRGH